MKNKAVHFNIVIKQCNTCNYYNKQNNRKKNPLRCEFYCKELGEYKMNQYEEFLKRRQR